MDEKKKEGEGDNYSSEDKQEPYPQPTKNSIEKNISNTGKSLTDIIRGNPFIVSTLVLGVLVILLLIFTIPGAKMTGNVVSGNVAADNLLEFLNEVADSEVTLVDVESFGDFHRVIIEFKENEIPIYVTKDGKYYTSNLIPLSLEEQEEPEETILECSASYGLSEDTIIFYYSDSCGWCSKMKPGVDVLEEGGYNVYRVEVSEGDEVIDNCVKGYMTSGSVPQFICVKTGEIHIGAFADENSNLDQDALNEWVDNCLSG